MNPSRSWLARLATLATVSVISLLLLEAALRLFDPIGISHYFEANRYFRAMLPDPDYGYIHPPGFHGRLHGVDVETNSEGFRGPEFAVDKPAGRRRILILGDSLVFGWGAPQDSILPARIQRLIDDRGLRCEVIGAGVGSWNTRMQYAFLQKRGLRYDPDLILLVIAPNDVNPSWRARTEVPVERLFPADDAPGAVRLARRIWGGSGRRSYVVAALQHLLKQRRASAQVAARYDQDSPAWSDARAALDGIIALSRERGVELVPFLYAAESSFGKVFEEAYGSACREQGVRPHLLTRVGDMRRYRNSLVDPHPNAAGHRILADEVFAVLLPRLGGTAGDDPGHGGR